MWIAGAKAHPLARFLAPLLEASCKAHCLHDTTPAASVQNRTVVLARDPSVYRWFRLLMEPYSFDPCTSAHLLAVAQHTFTVTLSPYHNSGVHR